MPFPPPLPHGPITRIAEGVHVVRGTFAMGPILRIGRTMTILQQGDELVVMNAIRLSPEGEAELSKLGTVSQGWSMRWKPTPGHICDPSGGILNPMTDAATTVSPRGSRSDG